MLPVGTNLKLKNFPWGTIILLLVNWITFGLVQHIYHDTAFWIRSYFLSTPGEQYPWQLITSMFFHGSIAHIIGNSIYLWIFGIVVEDKLGRKDYLFLYFLTGIAASLVHGVMVGLFLREQIFTSLLGASGAISGIMGVYLYRCYYSKIKLLILFWPVQIPTVIVLPLWFLGDFVGGIDSIRGIHQNVAFWAHVGGFVAGLGACKYLNYGKLARKERLEFVAETALKQDAGYGEGLEASEKLLEDDPENLKLHLNLAQAKTRWRASPDGKAHYEKAIKLLLTNDPEKAVEVFIEYWRKYLSVLEPRYQVRLSLLINKKIDIDLSARTLQRLIDGDHPLDLHLEQAYLNLARIYGQQLRRDDLARYVCERFLQRFPGSTHRGFVEKMIHSIPQQS